jgi:hypothetical protein
VILVCSILLYSCEKKETAGESSTILKKDSANITKTDSVKVNKTSTISSTIDVTLNGKEAYVHVPAGVGVKFEYHFPLNPEQHVISQAGSIDNNGNWVEIEPVSTGNTPKSPSNYGHEANWTSDLPRIEFPAKTEIVYKITAGHKDGKKGWIDNDIARQIAVHKPAKPPNTVYVLGFRNPGNNNGLDDAEVDILSLP